MHFLYNKNVSMVNELKLETADLILAKRIQCIHILVYIFVKKSMSFVISSLQFFYVVIVD